VEDFHEANRNHYSLNGQLFFGWDCAVSRLLRFSAGS
jgi:hypothetical protein